MKCQRLDHVWSQNVTENYIFKTTWQLYKEIESHVGRLCTVDNAIVFQ